MTSSHRNVGKRQPPYFRDGAAHVPELESRFSATGRRDPPPSSKLDRRRKLAVQAAGEYGQPEVPTMVSVLGVTRNHLERVRTPVSFVSYPATVDPPAREFAKSWLNANLFYKRPRRSG